MKIIVGTDFSPIATAAVRSAARLARKLDDSLLVVKVTERPLQYRAAAGASDAPLYDDVARKEDRAQMERAVAALRREGVRADGLVVYGDPAETIADLVGRGTRLIVVGWKRPTVLCRIVRRSLGERLAAAERCPVLLVPARSAPFDAWDKGAPLRLTANLTVDPTAPALLGAVRLLRRGGPCDVMTPDDDRADEADLFVVAGARPRRRGHRSLAKALDEGAAVLCVPPPNPAAPEETRPPAVRSPVDDGRRGPGDQHRRGEPARVLAFSRTTT